MFRRLRETLWRWELPHPEWTPEEAADGGWEPTVASYAAVAGSQLLLFDPLAPSEGDDEQFWRALDDDVRHHGPPAIVLTIFWHTRNTAQIADRYPGASV